MSTPRDENDQQILADTGASDDQRDSLVYGNTDVSDERDIVPPAPGNEDPEPERSLADEAPLDEAEFPEPTLEEDDEPDAAPLEEDLSDLLPEQGHGPDDDESALVEYGEEEDGELAPSDAESRLDDEIVRVTGDEPEDDVDPGSYDPIDADRGEDR